MSSVDVLTVGRGPGLVVIPGGTRRAHHYRALAEALADSRTVHVIERRGRGASPPQGAGYGLDQEVDDALEVLAETDSEQVFGHSFGGLVALHAALRRDLAGLIAYEPGVSLNGSLPTAFQPEFDRRLARGDDAAAAITFFSGLGFMPGGPVPTALMWMAQRLTGSGRELRAMLPTVGPELRAMAGLDSDGSRYASITAPTLLLGGGRSPAYLKEVLPRLTDIIPTAKLVITPEFDHNAPDLGAPAAVAEVIRAHW
jgi:pimeloyl-ACP methyl ester carboxylesterase